MLNVLQAKLRSRPQFIEVVGSEVGQLLVLAPVPQVLHRIQFRRVRRKVVQVQTGKFLAQLPHRLATMHVPIVVDQNQRSTHRVQQIPQEQRVTLGIKVGVDQRLIVQLDVPARWRKTQGRSHRDFLAMARALNQQRRATAWRLSWPRQRRQQKAAFIAENQGRVQVAGFFLIRGHWWPSHALISNASRSRGWRWGICGVTPWRRSQSLRYRRFNCTPNLSSMTTARRGAVHLWVTNPKTRGFSSTQQSTCSLCAAESLGGRPDRGRLQSPASPSRCRRRFQRRKVRGWTSRNSDTSSCDHPWANRSTANIRTCSAIGAVHGKSIMGPIMRNVRGRGHYFSDSQ